MVWDNMIPKKEFLNEKESNTDFIHALCMVLSGSTVTANAAKKSSNKVTYWAVFDAEYYYNSNPDLSGGVWIDAQKLFPIILYLPAFMRKTSCADFNVAIYRANYLDLGSIRQ